MMSITRPPPIGAPLGRASKLASCCSIKRSRPLVGNFEENILNNRLAPIRTVDGYVADVRASCNTKQPNPMRSSVHVSFYSVDGCFPYLGRVNFGHRGYKIPKKGTLQVTLFNPNGTLVKLFLLHYDLADMPPNSQTFLRQKTLFLPVKSAIVHLGNKSNNNKSEPAGEQPLKLTTRNNALRDKIPSFCSKNSELDQPPASEQSQSETPQSTRSRIKYLIQLNIVSSKSGHIYLNKDLRIFVSKKVDLETASEITKQLYELKAIDEMPSNPKYFSR